MKGKGERKRAEKERVKGRRRGRRDWENTNQGKTKEENLMKYCRKNSKTEKQGKGKGEKGKRERATDPNPREPGMETEINGRIQKGKRKVSNCLNYSYSKVCLYICTIHYGWYLLATGCYEHYKCGYSELRCTKSIIYILDFKDLV